MLANRPAALERIFASEMGFAVRESEPGGSVEGGITMLVYREYHERHHLPDPTIDDLKNLSDAEKTAIYDEVVLTPVRFDDLPSGVDYAVADYAVNSGVAGALNAIRFLFGVPIPTGFWRMDDALLAALHVPPPALAVDAICNMRWARMEAAGDFTQPSAVVPGKILGDGRAFRMSACHRGAMELLGFPPEPDRYAAPAFTPSLG